MEDDHRPLILKTTRRKPSWRKFDIEFDALVAIAFGIIAMLGIAFYHCQFYDACMNELGQWAR